MKIKKICKANSSHRIVVMNVFTS